MIADFIIERIGAYIAGGMKPETATYFTRGELLAIYKGDHYSRDSAGKMSKTPLPEPLDPETAMKKADAEIGQGGFEPPTPSPPDLYAKPTALLPTTKTESGAVKATGLEGLKDYVKRIPA